MPLNATLHITTARKNARTILQTAFCTQPFKIANITENKSSDALQLMLMSSSPGILDGDCYQMQITVGEGCRLSIETQSYQRLFQMKKGATQNLTITLEKGSTFCFLPHPVVPHRESIFQSRTKIFLTEACTLLWGEVLSCGRKLNGEVFQFTSFQALTELYQNGKLVVKENLVLKPAETLLSGMGQLEGYTHQATLLYLDEAAPVTQLIDELATRLNSENNIVFGLSALPVNGLVMRLLGYKAEQLFSLQKTVAAWLQKAKHQPFTKIEAYVA